MYRNKIILIIIIKINNKISKVNSKEVRIILLSKKIFKHLPIIIKIILIKLKKHKTRQYNKTINKIIKRKIINSKMEKLQNSLNKLPIMKI